MNYTRAVPPLVEKLNQSFEFQKRGDSLEGDSIDSIHSVESKYRDTSRYK